MAVDTSVVPHMLEVQAGNSLTLCRCLHSEQPPICDATHECLDRQTVTLDVKKTQWLWLCSCGESKQWPLCDSSHKYL